jgi:hypothetical protein
MIVHFSGEDWEFPHMRGRGQQDIALTPEECLAVPWAAAWKAAVTTTYIPARGRRTMVRFPRTTLSARFADADSLWLNQHDGMRSFALGPLRGYDDLLRLIRDLGEA